MNAFNEQLWAEERRHWKEKTALLAACGVEGGKGKDEGGSGGSGGCSRGTCMGVWRQMMRQIDPDKDQGSVRGSFAFQGQNSCRGIGSAGAGKQFWTKLLAQKNNYLVT